MEQSKMWQLYGLLGLIVTNFCLAAPQQIETLSTTDVNPRNTKKSGCGLYGPHDEDEQQKIDFTNDVAQYGELPWTVMLFRKIWIDGEYKNVHHCHGALINREAVLVSVHCVWDIDANKLTVRVGEWDTSESNSETHPTQSRNVSEIIYQDGANPWHLKNMVAILILSGPIEFGENANPACLPRAETEYNASQCVASGRSGKAIDTDSARLKRVKLPVVAHDTCQNAYNEFAARLNGTILIAPSVICAGTKGSPDICETKAGRPMVCPLVNDPSRYVLVGLGLSGGGCSTSDPYLPSEFVKVSPIIIEWIDQKMSEKKLETSAYTY